MAAPQIPNLLSRRGTSSNSTSSARGGGSGLSHRARGPRTQGASADATVQSTDNDAAAFRLAAVEAGYFNDPYAALLSPSSGPARRLTPFLNRGTYVRTLAIDSLIHDFLETWPGKDVQVVSLGAGADSRYLRLAEGDAGFAARVKWVEIDYGPGSGGKVAAFTKPGVARDALCRANRAFARRDGGDGGRTPTQSSSDADDVELKIHDAGLGLATPSYTLRNIDLRSFADQPPPSLPEVDRSKPTLLLAECCLTYIPSPTTTGILRYFLQTALAPDTPTHIVLYEPLHPHDAFGQRMAANLAERAIDMPGLSACPTIATHCERLRGAGFQSAGGVEVGEWWRARVAAEEKARLRRLQMVDEEEEWELMAGHYGFIWGARA